MRKETATPLGSNIHSSFPPLQRETVKPDEHFQHNSCCLIAEPLVAFKV